MTDDDFGPYESRDEWMNLLDEHGIELEESSPSYTGPTGAVLSYKAMCGCSKVMEVNGDGTHEVFKPCEEHKEDVPPFDVERKDVAPSWEEEILDRDPYEVEFGEIKKGDTLVFDTDDGDDVIVIVKEVGKGAGFKDDVGIEWSTLHPSENRGQFMSVGTSGTLYKDENSDVFPLKRLNKPSERYFGGDE